MKSENVTIKKEYCPNCFNAIGSMRPCPYCGNEDIVRCGACGKLKCHDSSSKWFRCSCGNSGEISGRIRSMSGSVGNAQ